MAATCGLHGLHVAGNNGCTKSLGKELARVQGGWAPGEGSAQTRYDRHDLADVCASPGQLSLRGLLARLAPLAGLTLPPIARTVLQVPTAARNIRQPQPFVRRPHTAAASARAGRRRYQ
eukprot:6941455-Prymnesium_polylepis.2